MNTNNLKTRLEEMEKTAKGFRYQVVCSLAELTDDEEIQEVIARWLEYGVLDFGDAGSSDLIVKMIEENIKEVEECVEKSSAKISTSNDTLEKNASRLYEIAHSDALDQVVRELGLKYLLSS